MRGNITGIAWVEYSKSRTVNGMPLPAGLVYEQKLPTPLWNPSTKAAIRDEDENSTKEQAYEILGERVGRKIEKLSLEIYSIAAKQIEEAGIILADTKLEFGTEEEMFRFRVKDIWEQSLGQAQPSVDKQYLRDWLLANGSQGQEPITIPEVVVIKTDAMYHEACKKLMG
ncbi:uncharacterized protein KY384_006414 [Bacidia gigantensis]|uniref:uncharacterized protein n=1 Tax=Bacidia gigantensis TaxID=2732470 RepID=UPI001D037F3A|nr:uncharacterized protein KY384_006414 [Bacidia gigantensis]KAG8528727.1 hypothetical protein KY384_006414 [Bacidia gigantensis]